MSEIIVKKPTQDELKNKGVFSWPIWEKEASIFDWHYDDTETCYILDGDVKVSTKDGKEVRFAKGDMVIFPKGLDCKWEIKKAVKKHYNFG